MAIVVERWLMPDQSRPDRDAVKLDDSTYCWADHNTNNFHTDRWTLFELRQKPHVDVELLCAALSEPDITGSNLVSGTPSNSTSSVDKSEESYGGSTNRPTTTREPKNNDGRTHCYKCKQPVELSGGGMYQICGNKNCEWYQN